MPVTPFHFRFYMYVQIFFTIERIMKIFFYFGRTVLLTFAGYFFSKRRRTYIVLLLIGVSEGFTKKEGLLVSQAENISCTRSRLQILKIIFLQSSPLAGLRPMRCVVEMLEGSNFYLIPLLSRFWIVALEFSLCMTIG